MRDPRFSYFNFWGCGFDGTQFWFRNPLFMIHVAYGAKEFNSHTYWWGFEFHWEPNQEMTEGSLFFNKSKKVCFREYAEYKRRTFGSLPL